MLGRREFLSLSVIGGAARLWAVRLPVLDRITEKEDKIMAYTAKDFSKLIGMPGFSETLLKNHFTLYQGYVANTNRLLETLAQMGKDGKLAASEAAELRRRLGWEWNGMRLHELYFGNLGGQTVLALLRPPISQDGLERGRAARVACALTDVGDGGEEGGGGGR